MNAKENWNNLEDTEPSHLFRSNDPKAQEITKRLASKLAAAFDINEYLSFYLMEHENEVGELVKEKMQEENFPASVNWKSVKWDLTGKNIREYREWLNFAARKRMITGFDLADGLKDFISSTRDLKMYAAEDQRFLSLAIKLLETPREWEERQGKIIELAKKLEDHFDQTYLGLKLATPEYLTEPSNPTIDLFEEVKRQEGFPKEATVNNTKFKVVPKLKIGYDEFAKRVSLTLRGEDGSIDYLLKVDDKYLNEIYLNKFFLPYLAYNIQITEEVAEWEERNEVLSKPDKALGRLAEAFENNFNGLLIGEMLSTKDNLQISHNTLFEKVKERLQEEGFPKQATPNNVDFDATAVNMVPFEDLAQYTINNAQGNYQVINQMINSSADNFNAIVWKSPAYLQFLSFDVKFMQTVEEWSKENADRLAEDEY